jgi:hypothetical protein
MGHRQRGHRCDDLREAGRKIVAVTGRLQSHERVLVVLMGVGPLF